MVPMTAFSVDEHIDQQLADEAQEQRHTWATLMISAPLCRAIGAVRAMISILI